ncbi:MAG: sigma-70 family RNA polymerase sigma factor [Planctomycetota bacterium]|nr:MAG: sigma-70 family RNA polymerase sigma factor [Planctomycetota bacterium]
MKEKKNPLYSQLSDESLIERAQKGDEQAFNALYDRHKDRILNFSYALTGDREAPWDVLQETFLYLFKKLPHYRQEAKFTTLLYKVVKNLSITILRKNRKIPHSLEEDQAALLSSDMASPDEIIALEEQKEEFEKILFTLSPTFREVLYLKIVEALEYSEIAEILDLPLGTVKSRLHYGWKKLVEKLEGKMEINFNKKK